MSAAGGAPGFVFINRHEISGGRHAFIKVGVLAGDYATDVIERASVQFGFRVPADCMELYLVRRSGRGKPTPEDISTAMAGAPLDETLPLSDANVPSGSCLVLRSFAPSGGAAASGTGTAAPLYFHATATAGDAFTTLVKKVEDLALASCRQQGMLENISSSLLRPASSPDSVSHLGMSVMRTLVAMGAVTEFSATSGEAVLAPAAQSDLASLEKEADIVAGLTPPLSRLRLVVSSGDVCPRVLVNSVSAVARASVCSQPPCGTPQA